MDTIATLMRPPSGAVTPKSDTFTSRGKEREEFQKPYKGGENGVPASKQATYGHMWAGQKRNMRKTCYVGGARHWVPANRAYVGGQGESVRNHAPRVRDETGKCSSYGSYAAATSCACWAAGNHLQLKLRSAKPCVTSLINTTNHQVRSMHEMKYINNLRRQYVRKIRYERAIWVARRNTAAIIRQFVLAQLELAGVISSPQRAFNFIGISWFFSINYKEIWIHFSFGRRLISFFIHKLFLLLESNLINSP